MFCQSCGTQLTKGLVYCNRCGARVAPDASPAAQGPPADKLAELMYVLATFTALVAVGGFVFVYYLAGKLMLLGFEQSRILVTIFFCLAAAVGVSGMLVGQFSRVLTAFLRSGKPEEARAPELAGRNTAQIEAPREPASSVTDHTTRTFDAVRQERRG